MRVAFVLGSFTFAIALMGCGTAKIPGTNIEDTPENRAIYDVVEAYRVAMEKRDVDALKGTGRLTPSPLLRLGTPVVVRRHMPGDGKQQIPEAPPLRVGALQEAVLEDPHEEVLGAVDRLVR